MPKIVEITGIGPTLATACVEAGFACVDKIAGATAAELAAVPGIGEMRAKTLINAAQSLLNGTGEIKPTDAASVKAKKNKKRSKNKDEKSPKKGKKKEKNKKSKKSKKSKKNSKKKKSKSGKKK